MKTHVRNALKVSLLSMTQVNAIVKAGRIRFITSRMGNANVRMKRGTIGQPMGVSRARRLYLGVLVA